MYFRRCYAIILAMVFLGLAGCCEDNVCDNDQDSAYLIGNCPADICQAFHGAVFAHSFEPSDSQFVLTWKVSCLNHAPAGEYRINSLGEFRFYCDEVDEGGTYDFSVEAEDQQGRVDHCGFSVEVLDFEPSLIRISLLDNAFQGHYSYVSISRVAGSYPMGGFSFLIGYDQGPLTFMSAAAGAAIAAPTGCGWEYFTFRYGPLEGSTLPTVSGFARVVAIADINNGPNNHPLTPPDCEHSGELASLKFYVSNKRVHECQFTPIRFIWEDCGDNYISSPTRDTTFISAKVCDYEWDGGFNNPDFDITGSDCPSVGYHFGGACADCDTIEDYFPRRSIWFWNGGIQIACTDSIDNFGDINLNGIANELEDALLYTNYFMYGIGVFHVSWEAQMDASDVNRDQLPLTVADLTYMLRVIYGDALPLSELEPFADGVSVAFSGGSFSVNAPVNVGAVHAIFLVEGEYLPVNRTNMHFLSNYHDGELRVLIYSGLQDLSKHIPAGAHTLFDLTGDVELVSVEISDYNGNLMEVNALPGGAFTERRE